jgi:Myb/SANT-like DNA-binding domain
VLRLISLFQTHRKALESSIIRRSEAWKRVANQMMEVGFDCCGDQCDSKFAALKRDYNAKKDNQAAGSSGHERLDFVYFDEMDEIFRNHPTVKPVALMSSSRSNQIDHEGEKSIFNDDTDMEDMGDMEDSMDSGHSKKKGRKRNVDYVLEGLQELSKEREAKKAKRHNELVNILRDSQTGFETVMTNLIDAIRSTK